MHIAYIAASIISIFTFGGAVVLLLRFRGWHFGFLAALTVFFSALILVYVLGQSVAIPFGVVLPLSGDNQGIPILIVSITALVAVLLLERISGERRRAEDSLRLPKFSIERAAITAFWIGRDGRFLFVNDYACKTLGYGRKELLTKTIHDIDPKMPPEAWSRHWAEIKTHGTLSFETRHRTKNGRFVPVLISANHLEYGGNEFNCTFAQDVSVQKRAAAALIAAREQAELASRTKSDFLANMSHELRTPLNAIIGFSEVIWNQMFGPVGSKKYLDYAKDITRSGSHLIAIISDILDMSKIETGKTEVAEEDVDLEKAMESCLALIAPRAKEAKVSVHAETGGPLPALKADPRMVRQILLNLLSNSVKFTPKGGRVTVRMEIDPKGRAVLVVSDTGIGIAKKDIPKITVPFGQLEGAMNRKHEGTGLGLALVRSYADLHDADLEIDSTPGKGTTVAVRFPSRRTVGRTPRPQRANAPRRKAPAAKPPARLPTKGSNPCAPPPAGKDRETRKMRDVVAGERR